MGREAFVLEVVGENHGLVLLQNWVIKKLLDESVGVDDEESRP